MNKIDSELARICIQYGNKVRAAQPEFWEKLTSAVEDFTGKTREEIARDGEARRKAFAREREGGIMIRGMSWEEYFSAKSEKPMLEKVGVLHGETDAFVVVDNALEAFAEGIITSKDVAEVAYTAGSFSVMNRCIELGIVPGPVSDIYSDDLTPDQK